MSSILIFLTPFAAIIDWVAVKRRNKRLEFAAKPAVILLLLAWLWSETGLRGPAFLFGAGLLFSLAGDIFLMLPREQFIPGLLSFLIAHLLYSAGFATSLPKISFPVFILAALIALTGWQIFSGIRAGLVAAGRERLVLPVLAYTLVIGLMLFTALLTLLNDSWSPAASLAASAGALSFFLSDTLLAWNKFVEPVRHGRLAVIIAYHLGQAMIALGVVLFLSGEILP